MSWLPEPIGDEFRRELRRFGPESALADVVQNRYLLIYTPSNQTIDGSWRSIAVSCGDPRYVVKTRTGYFAPKPGPIRPTIEFTAVDPQGQYLEVSAEDLEVVENGVAQRVDVFQEATQPRHRGSRR